MANPTTKTDHGSGLTGFFNKNVPRGTPIWFHRCVVCKKHAPCRSLLRLPRIAKKSSPGHGPRVLVTRSAAGPHGLRVTSLNVCLRQLNAQKRSRRAHWPPQPGALAPGSRANGAQFTGHGARYVLGGTLSPGHGPAVTAYAANVTKYFKAQPARLCRFFVTWAKPVFFLARFVR